MDNEERLYIETESACASCGFKDARALTVHHIEGDETKTGKNEAYDNKILLCHNCHQCHHQGKGPSTDELKALKKRLIVKTLTPHGLNAMKEAYRRSGVVATPFLVNHLVEMRYLKQDDILSSWDNEQGGEEGIIDALYSLTSEGRQLLEKWSLK